MDTHYPHRHSYLHHGSGLSHVVQPVCVYCLHLLDEDSPETNLTFSMLHEIEDNHHCIEKAVARRPEVSLPYN
jgi:hypothetical protein